MEAPEKIYLNKHPFTGELHDKWLQNKWDDSDIEYTRTDAFIGKAATWFADRYQANGSYLCADDIEDFIKTIKGE